MKLFDINSILSLNTLNLDEFFKGSRPIVLYGAGDFCQLSLKIFRENNIEPLAICDSNPLKIGKLFNGFTIMTFDSVISKYSDFDVIIATSQSYYDQIKEYLLKFIPHTRISPPYFYNAILSKQFKSFLSTNKSKLNFIYNRLNDNISHVVMEDVFKGKLTHDMKYYMNISTTNDYFNEITTLTGNEYFIDGGAFNGDTLLTFINSVNNFFGKIYCFEPSKEAFSQLEATKKTVLGNDDRIVLYNSGLYDSNTKIGFNSSLPAGSTRIEESLNDTNSITVLSIDSVIDGRVTFIKMDIEGSELAALKGAEKTILKYKPKLAICVYHKFDDMLAIPEYIMSLGLDYKYYLRHHGTAPFYENETVFYAV